MRVIDKMAETIRKGMRSFLKIEPAPENGIAITETLNYENTASVNRIWYRGDGEELSQLYKNMNNSSERFWAAVPGDGMRVRKIHTGLPGFIVDILTSIVLADMNEIKLDGDKDAIWKKIEESNNFNELMDGAITDTLVVGDGAFRICYDTTLSKYPIIEYVSGENVEYVMNHGMVKEIIFKTPIQYERSCYILEETYGYGYINSRLYHDKSEVDLHILPVTKNINPSVTCDKRLMMAVPMKFFKSPKFKDRGKSIFDRKLDNFDALDEAWSQWMDALRQGRSKEYIPSSMLPRNPETGEIMKADPFCHQYIALDSDMTEGVQRKIELVQPTIPHESYLATYITALDLCLQGIISPSTIGIDVKKLDNAEAQREKEKTTLYTRNKIVDVVQKTLPKLIDVTIKAYQQYLNEPLEDTKAEVTFGEYANPSFESQVETVSKAKTGGIMSIEASVDELYGDTKDEAWKKDEVARIKAEQGIVQVEEPALNTAIGDMTVEEV